MKKTILVFSMALITTFAFAQKKELKSVDKALKNGKATEARATLDNIASIVENGDAKYKAQFYFLKAKTYNALAAQGVETESSYKTAADAVQKLLASEKESGKLQYTKEAKPMLTQMVNGIVDAAITDNNTKNYKDATSKLYLAYTLDKSNQDNLYYAAESAVKGNDYDTALVYYKELKDLKYTGEAIQYTAVNVETQKEESFPNKKQRDLYITLKSHTSPQDKKTPSRYPGIVKNIALIYSSQGKNEKALEVFDEAIAENPDNINLLLNKAKIYNNLGQKDKFKEVMLAVLAKNPDDVDANYNYGTISMQNGELEEARKALKKALSIDPSHANSALNLSTSYVDEGNVFLDKMNALGTSNADNIKYEEYKVEKDKLYRVGLSILEEAVVHNPNEINLLTQLKKLYSVLGEDDKFKATKAKLIELGQ